MKLNLAFEKMTPFLFCAGTALSPGVCVGLLGVAEIWMTNIQNMRAMQTDE